MSKSGWSSIAVTKYDTLKFSWEITSQSLENNTSTISWKLELIAKTYGALLATVPKSNKIIVDGNSYYGTFVPTINDNQTIVIRSGSTVVPHNADGTKQLTYSYEQSFDGIYFSGTNIGVIEGDGRATLDTIPRQAKINSAPNFTDDENPTITYSNPAGAKADKLMACISFDNSADNIPYRDISKTGTSYTFNLTEEERITLRKAMTSKNSMSVHFYIRTTFGSKNFYSAITKTASITDAEPVLVPTVYDTNQTTLAITGDRNILVKGYSNATYDMNAYAEKEATLTSYSAYNGSKTQSKVTGTFNAVESAYFNFIVRDSRGKTNSKQVTKQWVDYVKLTCNIAVASTSASGSLGFKITGNCYSGNIGKTANTLTLTYSLIDASTNTHVKTSGQNPTSSNNAYSTTLSFTGLDYTHKYRLEVSVSDALELVDVEKTTKIAPIFDWSESDFNFNVPVTIQENPLVDFVVATGTASMGSNGTWYWQKWASGKAECWGTRNYGNMGISTAWGNNFVSSSFSQSLPSGLFKAAPDFMSVSLAGAGDTSSIWIGKQGTPTASSSGGFMVMRSTSATVSQVYISFHAIGRWK